MCTRVKAPLAILEKVMVQIRSYPNGRRLAIKFFMQVACSYTKRKTLPVRSEYCRVVREAGHKITLYRSYLLNLFTQTNKCVSLNTRQHEVDIIVIKMVVTENKLHIRKTNLEALIKSDSSTHQHYSKKIFKGSQWSSEHQEYAAS